MPDLDLSNRMLGEFVLRERIGVGGHGAVYRCEQRALGRDAVVKVLRLRKTNAAQAERFVREAKLASRLDHPYSAHVYGFGVEDDVRWIAMELVQGVSLREWLKAHGPMPLALFVPFFELVAEVVHAAHLRGIVHRDLKPSNVMVIESGARWLPKLLDFGIARLFDAPSGSDEELPEDEHDGTAVTTARLRPEPPPYRTRTGPDEEAVRLTPLGAVLGSTPYMSPEQWREPWSVGPASDIYALGCLAHEALTGRTPFAAENAPGYRELHVGAEPPSLGDAFPPGVDDAIRRALAKSPDARQDSALELAAAFRAALRTEPREQLRAAAQLWEDRARSPGLLWGREGLVDVERSVPPDTMSELECSFVAASHRRARRCAWVLRILVGAIACGAIGVLAYRSTMRARLAEQRASVAQQQARAEHEIKEARITESELEQGRSALLHGEPEAQRHLAEAYRRDPAPTTAFMLARAMQPRLSELARLQGTYGRMWWATFSPDGTRIATADDRAAQVWDARTYRLLFTLPHGCEVYQVVYSPDGTSLVTVARTMVKIWDARTGARRNELRAKSRQAASDFYRAAISADGRFVAAIDVMSLERAAARLVALPSHGGEAGPPLLIDLDAFRIVARLEGHVGQVFSARWVPGNRVLTAGADGTARLWDGLTGRLLQTYKGGPRVLGDAALLSGLVVGGDADGLLRFWDAETGAKLWTLPVHKSAVIGVHLEGTDIVTRGFTGEISRWQLPRSEAMIAACARHSPCAIVP